LKGHEGEGTSFAFTRDDSHLVARNGFQKILVWDLSSGAIVASKNWQESRGLTQGGELILCCSEGVTRVRHPSTGEEIACLPSRKIHGAAFSPDGRRVVFVTEDKVTRIWDVHGGTCSVLADRPLPVDAVASGSRYFAVASELETAIIDAKSAAEVAWFPIQLDPTSAEFAISPDGLTFAGGRANRFYLFKLAGGK
jgi:WD40 repeat protein